MSRVQPPRAVTSVDIEALLELTTELSRVEAAAAGMDSPARLWLGKAAQCLAAAQAEAYTREVRPSVDSVTYVASSGVVVELSDGYAERCDCAVSEPSAATKEES